MKTSILPEGIVNFADYFKLNLDLVDILTCFEYSFRVESCKLPQKQLDPDRIGGLKRELEDVFPHVGLTSEAARREFLIAPVLMEAARHADARIKVEFPLEVDEKLKGTLDYLVRAKHSVLVVEAKNADLERGLTQLAIELVALDRWTEDSPETRLYGAVSTGSAWQFAFLERQEKRVVADLNTYGVPTALETVLQTLVALLVD